MSGASRSVLALVVSLAGCYGNAQTEFPEGLDPFEENLAPLPAPVDGDPCPETLSFHDGWWAPEVRSTHARVCIHEPLSVVWPAIRDPQTGRDPAHRWNVEAYDVEPEYDYSYQTYLFVDDFIDLELRQTWRHGLISGTDEAPLLTSTRWQKTDGSTAISTMEGSLLAYPLEGHPEITVIEYQYHLNAVARDEHDVIRSFLTTIFGRLRARAHGEALVPDDCSSCAVPPEGY